MSVILVDTINTLINDGHNFITYLKIYNNLPGGSKREELLSLRGADLGRAFMEVIKGTRNETQCIL
jgi:hypothetical protein